VILAGDFGAHAQLVRSHFGALLSAIGKHLAAIYGTFFARLKMDGPAATGRSFQALAAPLVWLTGSVTPLWSALSLIASDLLLFTKDLRKPFCEMIRHMVANAIKSDHAAFCQFLDSHTKVPHPAAIFERIDALKGKDAAFTWPTQMSLLLLFAANPSALAIANDFLGWLNGFTIETAKYARPALLIGWHAFALSYNNPNLRTFMAQFYDSSLAFVCSGKSLFVGTDDVPKYTFVDSPLSALYMNLGDFTRVVLPILMADKINYSMEIFKMASRLCKLSAVCAHPSVSLFIRFWHRYVVPWKR
jgi:hypothetical protein